MSDKRPRPEKFLKQIQDEEQKEKRGKLKIYLGAAPGVGKTHEMLQDALPIRKKGLDVLIGVVESHGRREIEHLIKNFEILPRKIVHYRDKQLLEFDLDAALQRHPGLILVDEMAHTNAPNLRHKKRWQDIQELLDRGIDVYTTLNVQHIESLNDDVAQIVHATIKETVPDSMIEMADTIELVDIPPDELLKRLQEGKVYIPEQAKLAVGNFFRKGNLIALRELALRTTAERVGAEVLLYRQGEGIKHIWPTKDKILVCVGPRSESLKLIRAARRMATSLQAEWIAVYVDTPKLKASEEIRNQAVQNLRLAEQLGAETRMLTGFDIVKEVMNFAREQNVTQIMIWKSVRTRWHDLWRRNLADELLRHSGEIDVYVMTGDESKPEKIPAVRSHLIPWRTYGFAIGFVVLATVIDFVLFPFLSTSNLIMVYLLAAITVALLGKIGPSVLTSILSVFVCDFFFIPPFYSFAISDVEYLFTLIVVLIVTQVISHLTVLTRAQAHSARLIENQTSALYTLSRQLASTRGANKLIAIGVQYIAKLLNCEVIALLPEKDRLKIQQKDKEELQLSDKEQSVAEWVYDLGQMAGFGTDTLSFCEALYIPLLASQGPIGVLRIYSKGGWLFTPEQMRLLEACANQIALALEVDRLQEKRKAKELRKEADYMRNALLQSVSQDMRAPLISVLAKANSLIELGDTLQGDNIKKLGKEIYTEIEKLNQMLNQFLKKDE
ncbi:MAG: hypothetical protein ACD_60C00100G0025 [uncultured bacterium]|nr:MAG: hypothetical protein ACD_60C00100G0025 [uncultured bacterium]